MGALSRNGNLVLPYGRKPLLGSRETSRTLYFLGAEIKKKKSLSHIADLSLKTFATLEVEGSRK